MAIGKTKAETQIDNESTAAGVEGHFVQSDGSVGMEAPLRMKGNKIEGVATPTIGTDAANKDYVDSLGGGGGGSLVKVSANDTTSDYLGSKLVAGANVTITEINDGGNEQLQISSTGGGGTGTAGRVDHLLGLKGRVTGSGTVYLFVGNVSTFDAPIDIDVAGELSGASISVNASDPSRDFVLELLVNGIVEESLALPSGSDSARDSSFSTAIAPGDKVSARLRRTAGSGRSEFRSVTAFVKMTED